MVSSSTDTDTSDTWLTYGEAAKRLGLSVNAVKLRVSRGKLLASRGNDGHPRVLLRVSDGVSKVSAVSTDTIPRHDTTPTPLTPGAMIPVEQALAMLESERTRQEAQTARRLAEAQAQHQDTLVRILAQSASERALLVERVDAAECRAERVEEKLDQVLERLLDQHQPWWSRWFGSSRRSNLRHEP